MQKHLKFNLNPNPQQENLLLHELAITQPITSVAQLVEALHRNRRTADWRFLPEDLDSSILRNRSWLDGKLCIHMLTWIIHQTQHSI